MKNDYDKILKEMKSTILKEAPGDDQVAMSAIRYIDSNLLDSMRRLQGNMRMLDKNKKFDLSLTNKDIGKMADQLEDLSMEIEDDLEDLR